MSENKHHKRHEIEHTDDMIDRISNLPDCILHHILSFLPTIQVVETSILSKRWKNLWASVTSLDLDESLWYATEVGLQHPPEFTASFENFEERLLRSQDAPKIDKIHLSCHYPYDPSRISSWICNAVMRNVRELELYLFANDPTAISQSIFDCKSLVILDIEMFHLPIPSHVYLPSLKILKLSLVGFPDDESTEKLFSNCPVLEELVLSSCECKKLNNITISSLTLKKLAFKDLNKHSSYPIGCKIKIDAKSLTCLEYTGYLTDEILLNNVPSLVKACIHIPPVEGREKLIAYRAVDLLKRLHNVAFLSVSNCTLECVIHADKMNIFPVFPNLTHLVVTTEIKNYTFGTFMYLLNLCSTLQSLSLSEGFSSCLMIGENDLMWLSVPTCMSCHLKNFTFKNFHANDSEIWFLKFVLKHARVLEKMNVWWCKTEFVDLKKQSDVRKELKTTEKSSAACICWN